ncbi:uncharacterized protein LOC113866631 [Abrus precatorius]|uniref:Uncharacterized protein LOC113866631 n=1 Tax=Abrus precatorius TaxID=3816 RepID=A0A8B8LMU6_ABRPR|nr:uncharacterized protein LOC113866631 [Abrus precatorius]
MVTSTLTSSSSSTPPMELNIATTLPIKLSSNNYPTWYKQITLVLDANNLLVYVNGTFECPFAIIDIGATVIENPAFLQWKRKDKYIFLALLGSYGSDAQIVTSSTASSSDAMLRLTKTYANHSRDFNVYNYLCSIKFIIGELALIGHHVNDLDLMIAALNDFGLGFREFSAFIRTCGSPFLFDELYHKLVDYEIFIQRDERHQHVFLVT